MYNYFLILYIITFNIIYNYICMEPIDTMKRLQQTNGNVYLHKISYVMCFSLAVFYGRGILYLKRMDKHG